MFEAKTKLLAYCGDADARLSLCFNSPGVQCWDDTALLADWIAGLIPLVEAWECLNAQKHEDRDPMSLKALLDCQAYLDNPSEERRVACSRIVLEYVRAQLEKRPQLPLWVISLVSMISLNEGARHLLMDAAKMLNLRVKILEIIHG